MTELMILGVISMILFVFEINGGIITDRDRHTFEEIHFSVGLSDRLY